MIFFCLVVIILIYVACVWVLRHERANFHKPIDGLKNLLIFIYPDISYRSYILWSDVKHADCNQIVPSASTKIYLLWISSTRRKKMSTFGVCFFSHFSNNYLYNYFTRGGECCNFLKKNEENTMFTGQSLK